MSNDNPTPLPITAHSNIFDRITIIPDVRGGTVITWSVDSRCTIEGPYAFTVEWAEHPDAASREVVGLAGSALTITDTTIRRFSKLPHSVYWVTITGADNILHYSDPVSALGNWNRHDFLIGREIVRREYLALTRYTGTHGIYLGRLQWGTICTTCSDWDTNMPTDAHCPTCYGTGFVGGYHAPSELWLGEDRLAIHSKRQDNIGVRNDQAQMVRAVACPYLTAKDIWVNTDTDERWSIESKRELVSLRGRPLVYGVEIRLIELGNIAYDIPTS